MMVTTNRSTLPEDPHGTATSLVEVVSFVRRNLPRILLPAVAGSLLMGILVVVIGHSTWKASATLVVVPPTVSSELKPPTLTVQGYEKLLTSASVIGETRQQLVEKGVIGPEARLRVGKELATQIFVAQRPQTATLAPLIRCFATGRTPKQAAAIVNTWTDIFLEKARGVMSGATDPIVKMVDASYSEARNTLNGLQEKLLTRQNDFDDRINTATQRWDKKITEYTGKTTSAVAQYNAQTTRLVNTFQATKNLETRKTQVAVIRKALADLQSEQARVQSDLAKKKLELAAAGKTLASTPQFLTLRKAITDDALWESELTQKPASGWERLKDRALVSQAVNPAYEKVYERSTKLEIEVNALVPRSKQLEADLASTGEKLQAMEKALQDDLSGLEALKEERAAGIENLKSERSRGLRALQGDRDTELQALDQAKGAAVADLQRDLDTEEGFFKKLADSYNQALLAKSQMNKKIEDVRLLGVAQPPATPEPRGALIKMILAGMLAATAGLVWALVHEASRAEIGD